MSRWVTNECSCEVPHLYAGQKKPTECIHHNRFVRAPSVSYDVTGLPSGPTTVVKEKPRKPRKRSSEPKRDWTLAISKVEEEGCCRICKRSDRKLDAAHVLGREHDEPKLGADGWPLKELLVHPDRIIPACGPYPEHCHGAMHRHEVDVLRYLTVEEQLRAVADAGSIEAAHIRLTAVTHV